jgi:hypothetical protein
VTLQPERFYPAHEKHAERNDEIRNLYWLCDARVMEIAATYGLSRAMICHIVHGRTVSRLTGHVGLRQFSTKEKIGP